MSIPYDTFVDAFLNKITDYDYIKLDRGTRGEIIDGYMKRACSEFDTICKYDLMDYDDETREFAADIPYNEIDEIINIVSEGMCVQWLKHEFYKADNLRNVLNTPDFYAYSPAELLYRVTNAYNNAKRDYRNLMRDYSYRRGRLDDLWL